MNSLFKIVIVNAVYPPEPVVSAQMGRDLAVQLVHDGVGVMVLCPSPSRPLGVDYSALCATKHALVNIEDGVEVVRLPSYTAPQSRFLQRMRESLSFGKNVCRFLNRQVSNPNVVYANAWPLLSQMLIARYCTRCGIPLVLHIQDIYPESILAKLPIFFRGIVASPLKALDRRSTRKATQVVVISENMRRTYVNARGISPERVLTINNWQDEQWFSNPPSRSEARAKYCVPQDIFAFVYLGNIGPVAGVGLLIRSFCLARLGRAQLLVIGDGSAKAANEELASRLAAVSIRFISCPDVKNVPLLQSMADVCLLPMKREAGMSSIPSKLPAYLLSAKPILATVDAESDTARAISEAQCGWVGEPENVDWLAAKMAEVAALPTAVLEQMGQRGRDYGLAHYSKTEGVRKLADVVLSAAAKKRS